MKTFFSLSLIGLMTFGASAQTDYNRWSVGASIGGHDGMFPTKKVTKLYQINHFGLDGRYMVNNRFGIMLDLGYDYLNFDKGDREANYWRTSIQGVVNAGDILRFDTWTSRVGLLVHGGFGLSHLWQPKEFRPTDAQDALFNGIDDMMNFTFGATPQVKLTDRVSLNMDLAFIFHQKQSNYWDFTKDGKTGPIDGYALNLSIGASFYLGKEKRHADWTPTEYGTKTDLSQFDAYEARIAELEKQVADSDNDGVVDARDEEPNTAEGALVDSKGKTLLDSDGDKVPDAVDACPELAGKFSTDGCPDSDNDGVGDSSDKCPNVAGPASNNGCPVVEKEVMEVMDRALKGVQFETGKDVLIARSFPVLDQVVKVMKEHPEYYLEISGHTDNVGTPEANMKLSENRVKSVVKYLTFKGVDESMIRGESYGETVPKASNETDQGRAENRRVEFNVVFE